MQWTCQAAGGPLWWPIADSAHWYRPCTPPEELAADYLAEYPHERGRVLVLTWWESWGRVGRRVEVEARQIGALVSG